MTQDVAPPLPKSSSNTKGCLIGCAIVALIGIAGTAIIGYSVYKMGVGALDAMTEAEPRPIPEVVMTEEESTAATEKFEGFKTALETGASEEKTFSFTGQEINTMLRANPDIRALGESVFVTIENGEVNGEISLNLGNFIPFLEGRYANGAATFSISARDGRMFVYVEEFRMKGENASSELQDQLRQQNLAEEMNTDAEFQQAMAHIDTIEVVEDKVVVTLK